MNEIKALFRKWAIRGLVAVAGLNSLGAFDNPIKVEHYRDGVKIGELTTHNGITDEGMNDLLDVHFRNQTQTATWYMGLVDNSGFSAFAAADVMNSHAGWSEATQYDEANRVTWSPAAAASRAISNSTSVDFSINATKTIKGIFITSNNTKSGTTGTLWATAAFSSTVDVVNGDVLKVTYTVSG